MIKTFKDFDRELKSQKIYEASLINDTESNDNYVVDDSIVPDLISDDKILSQICDIVIKKLNDKKNNLGLFLARPIVVEINNIPGVYFYNQDKSINIVVSRKNIYKYVYVFKEFNIGENNIADFVLTTKTVGFKELIDRLIDELKHNFFNREYVNEGRLPKSAGDSWSEGIMKYPKYTKNDVTLFKLMSNEDRKTIFNTIIDFKERGKIDVNGVYSYIEKNHPDILKRLDDIYMKNVSKSIPGTIYSKLPSAFINAYLNTTEHADFMKDLFTGTDIVPIEKPKGTRPDAKVDDIPKSGDDITKEEDVPTESAAEKFFNTEEYKELTKEYNNTMDKIYKSACVLCRYVKNNGILTPTDRKTVNGKRCIVITGGTGTGKSEMVKKALKINGMRKNVDYLNYSSGSTAPDSLYKAFYNFNGKLLIFDDTADLFRTEYKSTLWQNALVKDTNEAIIASPNRKDYAEEDDSGKGSKNKMKTYKSIDLTNQEKYFLEVGNKSNNIKTKFMTSERIKITDKYLREHEIEKEVDLTADQKEHIEKLLNKSWEEYSLKIKPAMPDRFAYDGVVIIITNKSRKVLREDRILGEVFKSIEGRAQNFEVDPKAAVLWLSIKETIKKQTELFNKGEIKNINACLIPPTLAEQFIEVVENTFATDNTRRYITYRLVAEDIHELFAEIFAGYSTEEDENWWIPEVKNLMKNRGNEE